jgi:hypothetical protein
MTDTSTAPEPASLDRVRRSRSLRRIFVVVLCAFLLAGLLGAFGVKSRTVRASGGGYDLSVTYAASARPGLAIPWSVEVKKEGGFDGKTVKVATTAGYFDLFDENSLDPDPASATSSGEDIVWEFEKPEGDTLTIDFDARVGPSVQSLWPPEAVTAVIDGGKRVVEVRYRTRVWP